MATDFDCSRPDDYAATVQDIINVPTANAEKAKRLVARLPASSSRARPVRSAPTARSTTP